MPEPGEREGRRARRHERRFLMAAALGQAPTQELVEATRGVERAALRRARRLARRGQAGATADEARLVLAIARALQLQLRLFGPLRVVVRIIFVAGIPAAIAVVAFASGEPALGAIMALVAAALALVPVRLWRLRTQTARAELVNRASRLLRRLHRARRG